MSPQAVISNENQARAAGFSTTADLDRVAPGSSFQATWTFRNTGTNTWNGRYRFTYTLTPHNETQKFSNSPLGTQSAWNIEAIGAAAPVTPGATMQVTLTLTAPNNPGTYATNWQLQTEDGQRFGPIRWLRAVVVGTRPEPLPTLAYEMLDFNNSAANINNMKPGQQFTGTWTLRNTGTAAWSGDFKAVYLDEPTPDTQTSAPDPMGISTQTTLRGLTGKEQVKPGETVAVAFNLDAPTRPGAYAFHWQLQDENGRSFGGTRWLQLSVVGTVPIPLPERTPAYQPGMNINPEVHGLDTDRLRGLSWVRYPFFASRLQLSPEEAYQQRYRHIIQSYAAAGVGSLLVLHQDTEWGNAPWDNGDWDAYATVFAQACGRVAKVCSEFGDKVAYQIFNEQDCPPSNPSAIPIPSEHFAPILGRASAAIRAEHPQAKIIIGGLNSGPDHAINYVKDVQKRLNGRLPVDALAYHPYGRYVYTKVFNVFGPLSEVLDKFQQAFPDKPMWITEFGLPGHATKIGAEHYPKIATYLREITTEVTGKYGDYVQGLIWFAWTDRMENAGILTTGDAGSEKPHVYEAFLEMKDYGKSIAKSVDPFAETDEAVFVSYASTLANPNTVPVGTTFTSRWVFKNSGTSTWDADYKLIYTPMGANPARMTSQNSYKFGDISNKDSVAPGQTVEFALPMQAPDTAGRTYYSQWQLCDAASNDFAYLYEEITVVPAPTSGTNTRTSAMAFVKDQTVPDHTRYVAGTDFDKQWLVRNTGSRQWGAGFRLVYLEGDLQLARGATTHLVPSAKPGETVTLTVPMTAPPARNGSPTSYKTMWRMQDDYGNLFGDPLWTVIVSTTAVPPTTGGDTALARLLNDPTMWYSQLDPRWSTQTLGNGRATIGSWGCLMTCMAMALTSFGTTITPPELNQRAKANGTFDGSAINFGAPAAIGGLRYKGNVRSWPDREVLHAPWTGEDPIERIDKALAAGNIVVAQVDTKPNNGFFNSNNEQHWVVIVKRTPDGSDYLIIDPLTPPENNSIQPRSLMSKYGNAVASATNETNLRNAIISTLVYHKPGGSGN